MRNALAVSDYDKVTVRAPRGTVRTPRAPRTSGNSSSRGAYALAVSENVSSVVDDSGVS